MTPEAIYAKLKTMPLTVEALEKIMDELSDGEDLPEEVYFLDEEFMEKVSAILADRMGEIASAPVRRAYTDFLIEIGMCLGMGLTMRLLGLDEEEEAPQPPRSN